MDVNAIKDAVLKLTQDETNRAAFAADPVKAVESVIGVDLPDELVNTIIKAAKDNLSGKDLDDIIKSLSSNKGLLDKIKGLFIK